LLTLRGTPTMYYGEELGMRDVYIPKNLVQDPFEKNVPDLGLGRDPERTPMQWDASENAGFSLHGAHPWLPISEDCTAVNVEVELQSPTSTLNLIRRLIELRRDAPALYSGTYDSIQVEDSDCYVYARAGDSRRFVVALNFSAQPKIIDVLPDERGTVRVTTYMDGESEVDLRTLHLRPNEGCVAELHRTPEGG
jgi:alpha-glucosidase